MNKSTAELDKQVVLKAFYENGILKFLWNRSYPLDKKKLNKWVKDEREKELNAIIERNVPLIELSLNIKTKYNLSRWVLSRKRIKNRTGKP